MLIFDPNQRYQDSRHIFQNLKVLQSVMGFGNRAQSFTTPYYLDVDSPLAIFSLRTIPNDRMEVHYLT